MTTDGLKGAEPSDLNRESWESAGGQASRAPSERLWPALSQLGREWIETRSDTFTRSFSVSCSGWRDVTSTGIERSNVIAGRASDALRLSSWLQPFDRLPRAQRRSYNHCMNVKSTRHIFLHCLRTWQTVSSTYVSIPVDSHRIFTRFWQPAIFILWHYIEHAVKQTKMYEVQFCH